MKRKKFTLTTDEIIMLHDFRAAGGMVARSAIWAYVEDNTPIPNELKPILYEILEQDYKGKSKEQTKNFWLSIVMEIIFLIEGHVKENDGSVTYNPDRPMRVKDAIEQVANNHDLKYETVERRYKNPEYKWIRETIKGAK